MLFRSQFRIKIVKGENMSRKLIKNIGILATPLGSYPKSGKEQGDISISKDVAIVCDNGNIVGVYGNDTIPNVEFCEIIDAKGALVTPGLVDSHTHLIFGGWRQHEVPLKLRGASYLEILEAGGGILDTVRNTRKESSQELLEKAEELLDSISKLGVTTLEAKSGYGLDLENEFKQMNVLRELRRNTPIDICPTFMGAHATPPEYQGKTQEYTDYICDVVIPKLAEEDKTGDIPLAVFCDVFCESGVFNVDQSRQIGRAHV